jgi:hypothetical protein
MAASSIGGNSRNAIFPITKFSDQRKTINANSEYNRACDGARVSLVIAGAAGVATATMR